MKNSFKICNDQQVVTLNNKDYYIDYTYMSPDITMLGTYHLMRLISLDPEKPGEELLRGFIDHRGFYMSATGYTSYRDYPQHIKEFCDFMCNLDDWSFEKDPEYTYSSVE